jgi:SAM-dependent methyltransferase
LVAGCGTMQAAHYAVRWPRARVVGIDLSATSITHSRELQRAHGLKNLELHQLSIERAGELGESFDHVVCTGVLHHLADPDAGLRALHGVLRPTGAMHLMLYAPYGRAGVYLLQEYCRRIGVGWSDLEIRDLVASLKALPADHPIVPLLRNSPDFTTSAGVADALLHPRDRSYSVPELMALVERAGLTFGRWIRQAPYLPDCGAIAATPHRARLLKLAPREQYAALELFRGTMLRHAFICYRSDGPASDRVGLDIDASLRYVPIRLAETLEVRDRLPPGAAAVLINRNHTYTDLYLPIDADEQRMLEGINAERSIAEIAGAAAEGRTAVAFFRKLWQWDQIVFDTHAQSERP